MRNIFFNLLFIILSGSMFSQMKINGVTYLGNEWINFGNEYLKIKVAEDGIYKINKSSLVEIGFWKENMIPQKIAIFNYGKQIPLYLSSESFSNNDYILFYGEKNRIALDSFLYKNNSEILNENSSIISDTNAYFLAYLPESNGALRFKTVKPTYLGNNLPETTFYLHTENRDFTNHWYKPVILNTLNFQYSHMVESEGFVKSFGLEVLDTLKTYNLNANYTEQLEINFKISNNQISNNKKLIYFNDKLIGTALSSAFDINKISFKIKANQISENNIIKITGDLNTHNFGLSHVDLKYPRLFDFEKLKFSSWDANSTYYVKLKNYSAEAIVFDVLNNEVIYLNNINSNTAELILKDNKKRKIIFDNDIKSISSFSKFTPKSFASKNETQYLIITSKKLYKFSEGVDEINNYALYRSSENGGEFKTNVVFAEDIYDQFGYGIDNHIMAFKNLNQYFKTNWADLEYIFLIGKAREYYNIRTNEQLSSIQNDNYFIPTFGSPPSDYMLFSDSLTVNSDFSIGRLAASSMNEVSNYLSKIKEHEEGLKNGSNLWVKDIIHLGGGAPGFERNSIKSYLTRMENIIRGESYGANVSTYFKDNTSQVQIANLPKIKEGINNGLGILNFFGHAAVGTFDFTLDNPQNYENKGRYPFMFSLGCYSGNICTNGKGISEDFVLSKDRGAIGFIAAAGTALLNTQGDFGVNFYQKLSNDYYSKSVGSLLKKIQQEKHTLFDKYNYKDSLYSEITLHQQLILHGDPALIINGFEKPDYIISSPSIATVPSILTVEKDSFQLTFTVRNLKKAVNKEMNITVTHYSPNNIVLGKYTRRITAPSYNADMSFSIKTEGFDVLGLNKVSIEVDVDKEIEEYDESNNTIDLNNDKFYYFYVLSNEIKTSYPCEFAIVSDEKDFALRANLVNASSNNSEFIIQIDTTNLFNSNLLHEKTLKSNFSLVDYKLPFSPLDSTTYYWRIRKAAIPGEIVSWVNSSFTFIKGSGNGWRQQHQYQFEENNLEFMKPIAGNKFEFLDVKQTVNVRSQMYTDELNVPFTLVNSAKYGSLTPFRGKVDAMNVLVYTPKGYWPNNSLTDYGSTSWSKNIFCFDLSNVESRKGVRSVLENAPDSSYILIYCYFKNQFSDFDYTKWPQDANTLGYTIYNTLESFGATKFNKFAEKGPLPYILIIRKGFGVEHEEIGKNIFDQINYTTIIPYRGFFGYMSNVVGPASKWHDFSWNYTFKAWQDSNTKKDTFIRNYVHISKIDKDNIETPLVYSLIDGYDLSGLDATQYPKIKLNYEAVDYYYFNPADIYHWTVKYEGFQDIYLNVDNSKFRDTIDQGEAITIKGLVGVYTDKKIDSIHLRLALVNGDNSKVEKIISLYNIEPQIPKDFEYTFDTKTINGTYQIITSVNYDNTIEEKILFNNSGVKKIYIKPDKINPILDVTFDGIKILSGDIVSPNTKIKIELKDENKYLLIDKKEGFKYSIKNKKTSKLLEILPENVKISLPTSTANNKAVVEITTELEDGSYELKANASDYSQNFSGNLEYSVLFRVVNKKEISNFVNYPNPFSNSTRFVFDVTGGIPDNLRITIMTISGKIVREITSDQIGPINIGRNISSYAWDGTDEFGNKLATGVYLYKINTSNKAFELNNKFQTDGLGKLVILR
jgi:Peptidase family C25